MKKLHLNLPLSLGALVVWLGLTLGGHWGQAGAAPRSLADAAAGGIGLPWVLAALFAAAVALASDDPRGAGLGAPQPLALARLAWPPLLYTLLMLFIAWVGGLPPGGVLAVVAGNTALVALSEELMFRAVLLQGFRDKFTLWPAVLMSSALFGVAHAANGLATGDLHGALWQALAAAMQGVAYAAIRLRTRSVWPMVLVHGLWDFSLMVAMLAAAADGERSVLPTAALLAVLPLCVYGLYLLRGVAVPDADLLLNRERP